MKKIPGTVYVVALVFIALLTVNYVVNNSKRADAQYVGTSNKGSVKPEEQKTPTPDQQQPSVSNPNQNSNSGVSNPVNNEEQQKNGTDTVQPEKSEFFIDVNVSEQKVRIYQNDLLVKEWLVSTGLNDSTPLGHFKIQNRGEWFFSEKYQEGAMWWVSFKDWGVYLFHSLPMDRSQNILPEEAAKLGSPASHGCVRLEVENAKWIYDHIPQGTDVSIHK